MEFAEVEFEYHRISHALIPYRESYNRNCMGKGWRGKGRGGGGDGVGRSKLYEYLPLYAHIYMYNVLHVCGIGWLVGWFISIYLLHGSLAVTNRFWLPSTPRNRKIIPILLDNSYFVIPHRRTQRTIYVFMVFCAVYMLYEPPHTPYICMVSVRKIHHIITACEYRIIQNFPILCMCYLHFRFRCSNDATRKARKVFCQNLFLPRECVWGGWNGV